MDESREYMRLELDGNWSAEEMGHALLCLSELYNLRLFLELLREETHDYERYYFEVIGPGRRWGWRKRLSPRGFGPLAFGFPPGLPAIWNEREFVNLRELIRPEEGLDIRRIRYASPGSADLVGIGAVVGHVKEFVLRLIERRDFRRQRELSDEKAELENERIRVENARSFVALAREVGYSDSEFRQIVALVDGRQEPLARLIEHQKLRSVSTPDASDHEG
jgi:hypothetical protein